MASVGPKPTRLRPQTCNPTEKRRALGWAVEYLDLHRVFDPAGSTPILSDTPFPCLHSSAINSSCRSSPHGNPGRERWRKSASELVWQENEGRRITCPSDLRQLAPPGKRTVSQLEHQRDFGGSQGIVPLEQAQVTKFMSPCCEAFDERGFLPDGTYFSRTDTAEPIGNSGQILPAGWMRTVIHESDD